MLLQSKFTTKYNEGQICLMNYLKDEVNAGVKFYVKVYRERYRSHFKEVGTNMAFLSEICPGFKIERYGYSKVPPG